jgi:hypothetical protein
MCAFSRNSSLFHIVFHRIVENQEEKMEVNLPCLETVCALCCAHSFYGASTDLQAAPIAMHGLK